MSEWLNHGIDCSNAAAIVHVQQGFSCGIFIKHLIICMPQILLKIGTTLLSILVISYATVQYMAYSAAERYVSALSSDIEFGSASTSLFGENLYIESLNVFGDDENAALHIDQIIVKTDGFSDLNAKNLFILAQQGRQVSVEGLRLGKRGARYFQKYSQAHPGIKILANQFIDTCQYVAGAKPYSPYRPKHNFTLIAQHDEISERYSLRLQHEVKNALSVNATLILREQPSLNPSVSDFIYSNEFVGITAQLVDSGYARQKWGACGTANNYDNYTTERFESLKSHLETQSIHFNPAAIEQLRQFSTRGGDLFWSLKPKQPTSFASLKDATFYEISQELDLQMNLDGTIDLKAGLEKEISDFTLFKVVTKPTPKPPAPVAEKPQTLRWGQLPSHVGQRILLTTRDNRKLKVQLVEVLSNRVVVKSQIDGGEFTRELFQDDISGILLLRQ